jgi:hypothetical protein
MVCEMKHEGWWTDILHWMQGTKCWSKLFPNFLMQFSVLLNVYCRSLAGFIASTIIKALWMCRIPIKLQVHTTTILIYFFLCLWYSVTTKYITSIEHNNILTGCLSGCQSGFLIYWMAHQRTEQKFNRKHLEKVVEH